jgi:hypothetical protein
MSPKLRFLGRGVIHFCGTIKECSLRSKTPSSPALRSSGAPKKGVTLLSPSAQHFTSNSPFFECGRGCARAPNRLFRTLMQRLAGKELARLQVGRVARQRFSTRRACSSVFDHRVGQHLSAGLRSHRGFGHGHSQSLALP